MNRVLTRLGFTAAAIVAGGGFVAHAQTTTTGAISGVVSDKNGAPLAGASIRLSSTQTSRTFVTNADGSFRLGLLNPGAWTVEITKAGFQKITQTVNVLVNQTQPINFKMAGEAATVVEVLGTASTVDTTTTQTGLTTTMDTLSSIPKGSRDFNSLLQLAPGVTSGGFAGRTDPTIGGGSAAENAYIVDGLSTNNNSRGMQGATLVTDFIDQVEIQTGGFKPEYSALGGVINAVTKSGSNILKGSAWATWDAIGIQALAKRNASFRPTTQNANSRYDVGAEVGGPILKDKLFFYAGVDSNIQESPTALPNNNGLVNGTEKITTNQLYLKLNWYVTQDQQITLATNVVDQKDDNPLSYPTTGNANIGFSTKNTTKNYVINYDWTINPNLFLSAKFGTTEFKTVVDPTDMTDVAVTDNIFYTVGPGSISGNPDYNPNLGPAVFGQGLGLAYRRGGFGLNNALDKTVTNQGRVDLSWFVGAHNMKFGISQLVSKYSVLQSVSGGERITIRRRATTDPLTNGTFNGIDRTFLSTDASVKALFNGYYAQDTWDVGSGLKLMYGFRYEIQDQRDYHDKTFLKFSNFQDQLQPRLGFTWDVDGDGRSKVSGSYARYFESIPQRMAIRVYANEVFLRYRYSRTNSTYNAATGAYAYNTAGLGPNGGITDFATPFSYDPIAEGAKLPRRDEYTLGYERTFASGWTAGIHAKYRELKNPLEDMTFTDSAGHPYDEGPAISFTASGTPLGGNGAAVIGNPGSFQQWRPNPVSMTLYWLGLGASNPNNPPGTPAGVSYNSSGINILQYYNPATGLFTIPNTGFTKAGNKYSSVDFTLDKKSDRDVFSFSYTWSRLEGNYEGVVSSSNGQADGNITASFDYYPFVGYGLLPNDRTHVVKLFASHRFDLAGGDLNLGVNWTYQSGTPVSLFDDGSTSNGERPGYDTANVGSNNQVPNSSGSGTHQFLDIGGYGNAVPANGQLGQYGRTPATNNVDFHVDFTYRFGKNYKMIPSVDMFNVFNTRYALSVFQQATDGSGNADVRYGKEQDWQLGRRYRFGVKFQF